MRVKALITITDFQGQKKSAILDFRTSTTASAVEKDIKSELNCAGLHNFGANLEVPIHVIAIEDSRDLFTQILFNGSILLK